MSLTYTWPGIAQDIREYVNRCPVCAANTHSHLKPAGLMERYAPVNEACVAYHIDFLVGLPPSREGWRELWQGATLGC